MERLQPFILRGEAAVGGGVDDQQHRARISGEIDVRPIGGRNVQIGDPCHRKASSWPASCASRLRRTPGHSCARIEYTTVSRTCPGITLWPDRKSTRLNSSH